MHPSVQLPLSGVFFLVGLILLVLAGRGAVTHLEVVARALRLQRFHAAFLIMAFATSLPELAVGMAAAFTGVSVLSVGNVLGSNIADLTLVLGIAILVAGRLVLRTTVLRDAALGFAAIAMLPFPLLLDGQLSRSEGGVLLVVFAIAVRHILRKHRALLPNTRAPATPVVLFRFAFSIVLLLIAAHLVVRSASDLAAVFGISPFIIGLLAVAVGTSLPELAFEISAARAKHGDFVVGDAAGSVVCNATLVLGLTALIRPITLPVSLLVIPALLTALAVLVVLIPLRRGQYRTPHAFGMLALYALFVLLQF